MACRLSDAKEYGEFEEQGGWCRCDIPYENWVVVKICLIEVPMCAKIVRNSVKIGRHTVEIAGEIIFALGNLWLIGTILKLLATKAPKVNENPIHGCVQVDYICENSECNENKPFTCSVTYQYDWTSKSLINGFYAKPEIELEELSFSQKITYAQIKEVYDQMPGQKSYILKNTSRDWARKFMEDLKKRFN